MNKAEGWAVFNDNGHMYVNTISDTRRAAIVNFLVTQCNLMVMNHHDDAAIQNMWNIHGKRHCSVCEVVIEVKPR